MGTDYPRRQPGHDWLSDWNEVLLLDAWWGIYQNQHRTLKRSDLVCVLDAAGTCQISYGSDSSGWHYLATIDVMHAEELIWMGRRLRALSYAPQGLRDFFEDVVEAIKPIPPALVSADEMRGLNRQLGIVWEKAILVAARAILHQDTQDSINRKRSLFMSENYHHILGMDTDQRETLADSDAFYETFGDMSLEDAITWWEDDEDSAE